MTLAADLAQCWQSQLKLLTFRSSETELLSFGKNEFCWGLFWVWMAGMGRAWDDVDANIFQKSGLPSLIYIFVLSFFLWLFIVPLRPQNWSLKRLTTLVTMTGIVGVIYSIPLEMMLSSENAATGNAIFLGVVAVWRVALLGFFLARTTHLKVPVLIVALLLPLSTIVNLLLHFDTYVHTFRSMGGIRHYYVITDTEKAERSQQRIIEEANKKKDGWYHPPSLADVPKTGKFITDVYSYRGHPPVEGFTEIEWGDPRYMSTTPLMNVLRYIGILSRILWPVMAIYYFAVAFRIPGRFRMDRNSGE